MLAALLSIPTGERYPPITLTPMQRRRQTLAVSGLVTERNAAANADGGE
jgi:hypothetical protein